MKKQKKTKESGGISRAASMDNEIFLIKMFFPSFLGLKKKPTSKKCSRVSPRTLFDRSVPIIIMIKRSGLKRCMWNEGMKTVERCLWKEGMKTVISSGI